MMLSELHLLLRGKRSQQATQSRIRSFDHLKGWDKHRSLHVWSMLKECHFEKDTLPQIYDLIYQLSVDWKLGSGSVPERQCFDPPGSIRQEESVLQNIYHPMIATGYEWSVSRHTGPRENMIDRCVVFLGWTYPTFQLSYLQQLGEICCARLVLLEFS